MEKENHLLEDDPANRPEVRALIAAALAEDVGTGDVTSQALLDADRKAVARLVARAPLVLAGLPVAAAVFRAVDPSLRLSCAHRDGAHLAAREEVMRIEGRASSILTAERVALNFLQRLSGIATLTAAYVREAVPGVQILDTRKTTPGWRGLEKYAVLQGGGVNHRMGLYDRVLIKDNHLAHAASRGDGSLAHAVSRAREMFPGLVVEVETDTLDQVRDALRAKPDWILLDNMGLGDLQTAAALCRGTSRTEASGGVNLSTVRAISGTGVDAVSVGALTHSAVAVDLALDFLTEEERA